MLIIQHEELQASALPVPLVAFHLALKKHRSQCQFLHSYLFVPRWLMPYSTTLEVVGSARKVATRAGSKLAIRSGLSGQVQVWAAQPGGRLKRSRWRRKSRAVPGARSKRQLFKSGETANERQIIQALRLQAAPDVYTPQIAKRWEPIAGARPVSPLTLLPQGVGAAARSRIPLPAAAQHQCARCLPLQ